MLSYNEIKPKRVIVFNGEPHEVVSAHVFRKQQRKPSNQTKLRSLISGKVFEQTFHQSEKVEEADISTQELVYIYTGKGEWWFHPVGEPGKRFAVPEAVVGEAAKFLKAKTEVTGLLFNDDIIGIRVPIKLELKVADTPPNVKGNTAQGGTKPATLETGAVVTVPLFVNTGDTVEVNTETGEYVQRVT